MYICIIKTGRCCAVKNAEKMKPISVAFNESAPVVSGPISAYHTIFGHQVRHCAGYPMWETDISEKDWLAIASDAEKMKFVRVAFAGAGENIKWLVGTSWK